MKLTKLYGNVGKHLRQPASSVANYALYFHAFGFQAAYRFSVKHIGFVFDFGNGQCLSADAVKQDHYAECSAEVSGIHHNVGAGRCGKLCFGSGFFEVAVNGFAAAFVYCRQLRRCLFSRSIGLPYFLRSEPVFSIKLSAAFAAFVPLVAVSATVLFDLF